VSRKAHDFVLTIYAFHGDVSETGNLWHDGTTAPRSIQTTDHQN
jgi:hypothetical protein